MPEVIFENKLRNLLIRRRSTYDAAFLALLERTIWGSGGLRYTINNLAEILNRIQHPYFLALEKNGQIIGALTLIHKTNRLGGKDYPAFYSYGLAIETTERGKGYGTLLSGQALRFGLNHLQERGIYYGYVEAANTRSLRTLQKVGRKSLGQYHSLLVSRLCPRDQGGVEKLDDSKREQLVQLLDEQYANHSLTDFEQSVKTEDYYVVMKRGEIIAGLQCERNHLTIKHLPGVSGVLLLKILPHIPWVHRLFPQGNYHFLTLGNIYIREGKERDLFTLIETVLAKHQLNFGMIYMDRRSPIYQHLTKAGKFGVFHALVTVPVHVMAYLKGFTADEMAEIQRQPLFMSMMDPV
jgi:RimJ/RimL family protein N-acetyltransferase